jgi:hypothetical protein
MVAVQEEPSVIALNEQREELQMLLRSLTFKDAFQTYLASQEDKQAAWLYRFYQDVADLQTCAMDVPLTVFARVTKVRRYMAYRKKGGPLRCRYHVGT